MPRKFITRQDVTNNAKDGVLEIGPNDVITAAAEEIAGRRNISIVRQDESGASQPGSTPVQRPAIAAPSRLDRTGDSDLRDHVIVSAVGRNRSSVLAEITMRLAELNANILDIRQTIVREYFSLILIADIHEISGDFKGFKMALEQLSTEGDYQITVQHEAVFRAMQRI
ncbi:MAG: ACT domain-containing protein [Planctomycetota bacterium]|nr:ACT domain-containing protein [Planctomycetota bacterium]